MDGKYIPEVKPVLESTSVTLTDGSPLYLYRYGNICTLVINVTTKGDLPAWTTIGTIPQKYRPAMPIFFSNMLGGSLYVGFTLNTNGTMLPSLTIPAKCGVWATVTYVALDRD